MKMYLVLKMVIFQLIMLVLGGVYIFTHSIHVWNMSYIYHKNQPNVGNKYHIHGWYGMINVTETQSYLLLYRF